MDIWMILGWSFVGLVMLVAAGTWLFNRRPGQMTNEEHRRRMRAMYPP